MHPPLSRVRVGVVLLDKDRILVVRMHRDTGDIYVLPGGGIQLNEGIFECARREAKEEAGIDIEIERVLYLKDLCTAADHAIEIVLLGKIVKGTVRTGSDPEDKGKNVLKEVSFVPLTELKNMRFHPKQLRESLAADSANGFKDCPRYLGKFVYPED
jgi:ADP-ribose pyrophosphatase YjhB (NUDIX family)